MDPEYGKGQELAKIIEELLEIVAKLAGLEFKTPPHDNFRFNHLIAGWVVNELKRKGK